MPTLITPSGSLEYQDLGPRGAPAILFVHGFLVDSRIWRPVAERLAATHRVILPDWPLGAHRTPMAEGADLSPPGVAALVAHVLEALDLDDVTLVGNDSGGAISQLVVTRHPARIGRLVLTNCDAFEVFPPKAFAYLALLAKVPGLAWLSAKAMRRVGALRRMKRAFGALTREPIDDELLRAWCTPAAESAAIRRDMVAFIRGADPALTIEAAEQLASYRRPVLLVWGDADPFFTVSLAERLAAVIPDARLERVEGAKAFVPLDAPAEVAQAIARFVARGGVATERAAPALRA